MGGKKLVKMMLSSCKKIVLLQNKTAENKFTSDFPDLRADEAVLRATSAIYEQLAVKYEQVAQITKTPEKQSCSLGVFGFYWQHQHTIPTIPSHPSLYK